MLSKYCPTFVRISLWLWESPTFTKWGNQGVQSLRFLLVTPLILTRFDETEIAAWYLFSSLNFLGAIITQRLGLTFSRMFAFAMGGASDLSPIKGKREQENGGQPNWEAFSRAYGTIGTLNLGIAGVNVLLAFGMGWFGLNNIIEGYPGKGTIWLAFAMLQATSFIGFIFQRYGIALNGMNQVALTNRWAMIFSMLSVLAGSLTLLFGGGMIALVVVMQVFSMIGMLRGRHFLKTVEGGKVLTFKPYSFDREVVRWAWPPSWKGLLGQFGMQGSLRLSAIFYTSFASKVEVASLLFAFANIQTITQIAQAPFSSVQPLMSRLLASGNVESLSTLVRQRMAITFAIMIFGILSFGLLLPWLLEMIGSKIPYISIEAWLLLGALTLIQRFDIFCCAISAIGNEMVYYWHWFFAALLGFGLVYFFGEIGGVYTPIICSLIPAPLLMGYGPVKVSSTVLQGAGRPKHFTDFGFFLCLYLIVTFLILYYL